jgi:hypothetical protein
VSPIQFLMRTCGELPSVKTRYGIPGRFAEMAAHPKWLFRVSGLGGADGNTKTRAVGSAQQHWKAAKGGRKLIDVPKLHVPRLRYQPLVKSCLNRDEALRAGLAEDSR